jgi:hypothetical protein
VSVDRCSAALATSFYNTIALEGAALEEARRSGAVQTDVVLAFFKLFPDHSFTPAEVHRLILPHAPITSVRRAITDLTKAGKLRKTSERRVGDYGQLNYAWALALPVSPLQGVLKLG